MKIECGKYDKLCQAEQELAKALNDEAAADKQKFGWENPTFEAKPGSLQVAACIGDFAFKMDSTNSQTDAYFIEGKVIICHHGQDRGKVYTKLDEIGCGHFVDPKYLRQFRRIL